MAKFVFFRQKSADKSTHHSTHQSEITTNDTKGSAHERKDRVTQPAAGLLRIKLDRQTNLMEYLEETHNLEEACYFKKQTHIQLKTRTYST